MVSITKTRADLTWVLHQTEGQFFECKGCIDRSGEKPKRRPARDVALDIAETLSAMANADGGVLVLGVEDDGTVSGADYPEDRMNVLTSAPKSLVRPALRAHVTRGPLVLLIEKAYDVIRPHVRERQQLVDLFFEERFEYPSFAWQEAIVNAVAHRDCRYEGLGIEVWMFDDRLEVRSPGELVEPVTLDRLLKRERIHASRNPRIVRVLTDLGYMREQGEGIPRMFEAMERQGLYPPFPVRAAGQTGASPAAGPALEIRGVEKGARQHRLPLGPRRQLLQRALPMGESHPRRPHDPYLPKRS